MLGNNIPCLRTQKNSYKESLCKSQSWQISWISYGENIRFHGLKQINRKIILESWLSKFCMLLKNEMENSDSFRVLSLIYTCTESHIECKSFSSTICLVKPLKSIFSYIRQDTLEPEHKAFIEMTVYLSYFNAFFSSNHPNVKILRRLIEKL